MNRLRGHCGLLLPALLGLAALGSMVGCGDADGPAAPAIPAVPDTSPATPPATPTRFSLLALGDSYTVGEKVPEGGAWPLQLADSLSAAGDTLDLTVIARTGWTTGDLLASLDASPPLPGFDLVTVMIGVNNLFQNRTLDEFAADLGEVLDRAVGYAAGTAPNVLAFSIPDYGVTPVGQRFGSLEIAAAVDEWNAAAAAAAAARGITWLDITPLSRTAAEETGLVARDDLHFSAAMYSRWVSYMLPIVLERTATE